MYSVKTENSAIAYLPLKHRFFNENFLPMVLIKMSYEQLELLSFFMIELCLVEYKMLKFRPSLLAAAAIYTAQSTLKGFKYWSKTSERYTRYSEDELL